MSGNEEAMQVDPKAVQLGASTVSRSEVDLFWSPPVDVRALKATRYELQCRVGRGKWGELDLIDKGQWFSHRHSRLSAGRRYHFRIRGHFQYGPAGEWSEEVSALTEDVGIVGVLRRLIHRIGFG